LGVNRQGAEDAKLAFALALACSAAWAVFRFSQLRAGERAAGPRDAGAARIAWGIVVTGRRYARQSTKIPSSSARIDE
jgi:hypothetical protein